MAGGNTIKTFYRRALPDICISFSSERGKNLFKDALSSGYMNCYFPLASQFRTQDEPAYCGLSSLVMVLNTLAIDPGVVWKGVFRWYHEDMLDCCTPLEEVRKKGVSMDNLMCLAFCNQLSGEVKRACDQCSVNEFREDVKIAASREDRAIIVSYGRQILGQTGTGHFSPIGGYNPLEDMVLILDVARFKYPPYWVPLQKLWDAMNTRDVDTGLQRGYMTLWRSDSTSMPSQPPLLFKVSQRLNASHSIMKESGNFLMNIQSFLSQKIRESNDGETLKAIILAFFDESFKQLQGKENKDSSFLTLRVTEEQLQSKFPEQVEAVSQMVQAIEETYLCQKIERLFPNGVCCRQALFVTEDTPVKEPKSTCGDPKNKCLICLKHFLTVFMLSFPVDSVSCHCTCSAKSNDLTVEKDQTYLSYFHRVVDTEFKHDKSGDGDKSLRQRRNLLLNEVTQLRKQFSVLMNACEQRVSK